MAFLHSFYAQCLIEMVYSYRPIVRGQKCGGQRNILYRAGRQLQGGQLIKSSRPQAPSALEYAFPDIAARRLIGMEKWRNTASCV